ncbi:ABC transporter ATP-binding protein [Flavivirga algicola]|uniref:ABC transporter ATP-binding protein n=1 Tax=Flavivirga algicola TaxID=2729136 RepID=A0ABX1S4B2_9FLAO|nr:ABC transporter ATP-binding protein [Flavivirga algicola]NMH89718.1 ABC transporter ATP-binding protein [Flavivirga algicola]
MISTQNLTYGYSKKELLFKDLNFTQSAGSIIGLLGKNGAGKSTLLKLISGLLYVKDEQIKVNGYIPHKRDPDFLSDIFFVNDTPFLPSLTIKTYLQIYGALYKSFDIEKMYKILLEFELQEDQNLKKLSHGQQKKFIIAFALSTNCKLLMLDEPTNGLDIPSKSVFRKVLVNSVEDDQLVIISTHQVKDVETLIDKIIVVENGSIVFNEDVYRITEKLQFKILNHLDDISGIIYSEKSPMGYKVILPVNNDEETEMDIELMFNAICNKTEINL